MELLYPRKLPNKDRDVAKYLHCLCGVVGALHKNGFVHRDIKPSNVLFRKNGELVLVDYGLVKAMALSSDESRFSTDITQPFLSVGTNRYAAPEQLMGESANAVADIHSIGVLIDTCFNGLSPKSWRRIIQKATSSIPKQRFPSVYMLDRAIRLRFSYLIFIALGIGFIIICLLLFYVLKQDMIVVDHPVHEGVFMQKESIKDVQKKRNVGDSAGEWF
jgi:serine/threonine protein kinase